MAKSKKGRFLLLGGSFTDENGRHYSYERGSETHIDSERDLTQDNPNQFRRVGDAPLPAEYTGPNRAFLPPREPPKTEPILYPSSGPGDATLDMPRTNNPVQASPSWDIAERQRREAAAAAGETPPAADTSDDQPTSGRKRKAAGAAKPKSAGAKTGGRRKKKA